MKFEQILNPESANKMFGEKEKQFKPINNIQEPNGTSIYTERQNGKNY